MKNMEKGVIGHQQWDGLGGVQRRVGILACLSVIDPLD